MSRHDYKNYDDDALIREIILGEKTYGQIAEEMGLSITQVSRIALGQCRPELQERLEAALQGFYEQARRLGARVLPLAVRRLAALIAGEKDVPAEVQRQAAVDLIRLTVGDLHHSAADQSAPGEEIDMITVECKDGALALPADAFVEPDQWPEGFIGEGLSKDYTRAEYLRIIASRVEKGAPAVYTRPEDYRTNLGILADRRAPAEERLNEPAGGQAQAAAGDR